MTEHEKINPAKAVITGAEPQLFVADIEVSRDFFVLQLGFTVEFAYGTPPFYAQVARGSARINLRRVSQPVFDAGLRESERLVSASLTVASEAEIEALFREFQAAGVSAVQPLTEEPWGAKDFIVKDPDGNLLLFAGPADGKSEAGGSV